MKKSIFIVVFLIIVVFRVTFRITCVLICRFIIVFIFEIIFLMFFIVFFAISSIALTIDPTKPNFKSRTSAVPEYQYPFFSYSYLIFDINLIFVANMG